MKLFSEGQSYIKEWVFDTMIKQLEDKKTSRHGRLSEPQQALLTAMELCKKERKDIIKSFKSSETRNKLEDDLAETKHMLLEEQTKNKVLEDKINDAQVTAGLFIDSVKSKIPFMFNKED